MRGRSARKDHYPQLTGKVCPCGRTAVAKKSGGAVCAVCLTLEQGIERAEERRSVRLKFGDAVFVYRVALPGWTR